MLRNCHSPKRFVFLLLLFASTYAAGEDRMAVSRFTIDGGGISGSTGRFFELSGTIGQFDAAEPLTGRSLELVGGFWFEQTPCDCNYDGGVTLLDFVDYQRCVSGPGGDLSDPACSCFDLDHDNDVDLSDIGAFQRLFRGE